MWILIVQGGGLVEWDASSSTTRTPENITRALISTLDPTVISSSSSICSVYTRRG
jgi:hypothetical protein